MSSFDLWVDAPLPPTAHPHKPPTPQEFIAILTGPDKGLYTNGPLTQTAREIVAGWLVVSYTFATQACLGPLQHIADPDHWARLQLLVLAEHGKHICV